MELGTEVSRYRLDMDHEWELLELSSFGRQYVQVYSLLYALHFGADSEDPYERTARAFRMYPWAGGWSAVDFYAALRTAVPRDHRPHVVAIQYSSPGYIELIVALGVCPVES